MKKIHAILLAAGNSRRFDGNKLLYPYRGKPMYRHILERISEAAVSESEGCKMGIRVLVSQYEEILKRRRISLSEKYKARAGDFPVNPHGNRSGGRVRKL